MPYYCIEILGIKLKLEQIWHPFEFLAMGWTRHFQNGMQFVQIHTSIERCNWRLSVKWLTCQIVVTQCIVCLRNRNHAYASARIWFLFKQITIHLELALLRIMINLYYRWHCRISSFQWQQSTRCGSVVINFVVCNMNRIIFFACSRKKYTPWKRRGERRKKWNNVNFRT